jgi:hypothetical protein
VRSIDSESLCIAEEEDVAVDDQSKDLTDYVACPRPIDLMFPCILQFLIPLSVASESDVPIGLPQEVRKATSEASSSTSPCGSRCTFVPSPAKHSSAGKVSKQVMPYTFCCSFSVSFLDQRLHHHFIMLLSEAYLVFFVLNYYCDYAIILFLRFLIDRVDTFGDKNDSCLKLMISPVYLQFGSICTSQVY